MLQAQNKIRRPYFFISTTADFNKFKKILIYYAIITILDLSGDLVVQQDGASPIFPNDLREYLGINFAIDGLARVRS